jgi:pimeloyl-ACP methyl ester carboxylesterase
MNQSSRNLIFAGLLIVLATLTATSQRPPKQRSGDLNELVEKASRNLIRRDSDAFRVPTDGQLKAWAFITKSVLEGRPEGARKMIEQLSFPYEISFFRDDTTKREYVVIEENVPLQAGWGLFVFDTASKNNLAIEVPHAVFDSNTEFQGINAFRQTQARAFIMAGAHRRANKQDTPCTEPGSANADTNYPVSDVAHAVATPFHAVHEALVTTLPATVAVQLHGMTERDICPNVFLSTGTSTVTTNSKKLTSCLQKSGVETGLYDGKTSCPLTALSNVQGRFSNGERKDPCHSSAKSSPEPGHFIHIEQEPKIRRDKNAWQPVIDALKCAFPSGAAPLQAADGPTLGTFLYKSDGNPDVQVFFAGPAKTDHKTRLLIVMAGRQRNAEEYLDSWREWAAAKNYVVLAPLFDQQNWPEPLGYNFGNIASGKERSNTPNPKSKWSFKLVDDMFDEAVKRFSLKATNYHLFGHSAGGQFVHRFMLYYPENRVRLAIAANPGFYTLPDEQQEFPYGLKNSPHNVTRKMLEDWMRKDLVIMRGTADLERTESLRQSLEADAQGQNRFERAAYMFRRIKAFDPRTKWRMIDVPGIAHDQKGMAEAAKNLFADSRK